ncbi:AMP-binding protein [Kitasatospora sp. NPDC048239]|uniref:AMP-binding protein n=1 Tax=Kitasatospora sp. NPDC048239 TaxID=3364046 RepID=UPI00372432A6
MTAPTARPSAPTRVDLLRRSAAQRPDHVVLATVDGPALTYAEWDARSDALARHLSDHGAAPGGRIALVFPEDQWVSFACWHAAALKAGATVLPVSARFTAAEIAGLLAAVRPSHVVCAERPDALTVDAVWLDSATVPAADGPAPPRVPVAEVSELVCTSGTTGRPKIIACSEANLLAPLAVDQASGLVVPTGPERSLHSTVIGTAGGQRILNGAYIGGGSSYIALPDPAPRRLLEAVDRYRPDRIGLVPASAAALVEADTGGYRLDSVRVVTVSTAAATATLLTAVQRLFPLAGVVRMYGATEILPAGAAMLFDPALPEAVGAPVGRTLVSIRDEDFAELPPGATGLVWLRYAGAPARRLWVSPEDVRDLDREGWLWAGDLGSVDAAGLLRIDGRADDVLNVAGMRVSPGEIEAVLAEHPAVVDLAVHGEPDGAAGDRVAAVVVARRPVEAAELRRFAAQRLARHKVPSVVRFVPALPRGATGKVRRHLLAASAAVPTGPAPVPTVPAAGAAEPGPAAFLRAVWAEHTTDDPGVDAGFFDLGGTSVGAMLMLTRIEEEFAVELPAEALYTHPTLAGFTRLVAELTEGAVPLPPATGEEPC